MRKFQVLLLSVLIGVSTAMQSQEKSDVIRLDPALDEIVSADAKVEKLAGNLVATNGPLWMNKGGYLLFSDPPANIMYKWDPRDGRASVYLDKSGLTAGEAGQRREIGSNGTTLDGQGRIVFCAQGDRQIVRLEADGKRTVLISAYQGKPLDSPNDLVYKSDGSLYVTDLPAGMVLLLKDGVVRPATTAMQRPNGLAFAPDEKHLYISENAQNKRNIMRFEVQPDDTLANPEVFLDMNSYPLPWLPDALKVDERGNVYSQGEGGLWIITPAGKHIGTILIPERPTSQAFGDADGKTLYVTARTSVYRIRLKMAGNRPK
jgi:gluconolactonase